MESFAGATAAKPSTATRKRPPGGGSRPGRRASCTWTRSCSSEPRCHVELRTPVTIVVLALPARLVDVEAQLEAVEREAGAIATSEVVLAVEPCVGQRPLGVELVLAEFDREERGRDAGGPVRVEVAVVPDAEQRQRQVGI